MNETTIAFASQTANASIVIVDRNDIAGVAHLAHAQQQLESVIKIIDRTQQKMRLLNDTMIYFIDALHLERLRGLRLDRIEVAADVALSLIPEGFLESRLRTGVTPEEGILFTGTAFSASYIP